MQTFEFSQQQFFMLCLANVNLFVHAMLISYLANRKVIVTATEQQLLSLRFHG